MRTEILTPRLAAQLNPLVEPIDSVVANGTASNAASVLHALVSLIGERTGELALGTREVVGLALILQTVAQALDYAGDYAGERD
jgi:hypothetical protein